MFKCASILAILAIACGVVGCTSLQPPTGRVESAAIEQVDEAGFILNVELVVDNPNQVALPVAAADYRITVAGRELFKGTLKPTGSIPPGRSAQVGLPVRIEFHRLLEIESSLSRGAGRVPYQFRGDLFLGHPLLPGRSVRLPLEHNSTLDLRETLKDPQMLLGSEAAQRLARSIFRGGLPPR